MEMNNCRVLVTGGARRVGKAIVLSLLQAGCRVAVHYNRSRKEAESLKHEMESGFGGHVLLVQGDVRSRTDWERMQVRITNTWDGLDVLVHNAAIFGTSDILEADDDEWREFMDVNLMSVVIGSQIFAPGMKQQGSGKIIAIGDVAGELIWPSYIPYAVSKAGVLALVSGLAQALAPEIQVNAVSPGPVLAPEEWSDEDARKIARELPLQRLGSPEDVADAVRFLIYSGDFITGQNIRVDGGRMVRR